MLCTSTRLSDVCTVCAATRCLLCVYFLHRPDVCCVCVCWVVRVESRAGGKDALDSDAVLALEAFWAILAIFSL